MPNATTVDSPIRIHTTPNALASSSSAPPPPSQALKQRGTTQGHRHKHEFSLQRPRLLSAPPWDLTCMAMCLHGPGTGDATGFRRGSGAECR
ncbi:hypothetical protein N3K66_003456 [Trichothecium roseum]|uniref:Uncharacterized protein n=1 Tax=Trichothecium roseum TaxID=47278 RepID=A0ACC0V7E3_9HYPO|nr:hypothetical protein N3K66_003456 [Trichothecium roseum]